MVDNYDTISVEVIILEIKKRKTQVVYANAASIRVDYTLFLTIKEISEIEDSTVKNVAEAFLQSGLEAYRKEKGNKTDETAPYHGQSGQE